MQTIVRTLMILAASLLITGLIYAIGQTELGSMEGRGRGPGGGGRVNFHVAAERLGISEEELMSAIDTSPPNFEAASEKLGIPAAQIEAALQGRRGGGGPGEHEADPFSGRSLFGFGETILPIALIIALFTWGTKGYQAFQQRKAEPA